MSTSISTENGIKDSWSLIDFAKSHGRMQVGEFTNSETGEVFKSCIFTHPTSNTRTFVAFSSKLGVLSPKEIAQQKDCLQVVELGAGGLKLCKTGSNAWQDVDLDL